MPLFLRTHHTGKADRHTQSSIVCLWGLLCGRNLLCLDISEPSLSHGGRGSLFPRTHYEGKLTTLCLPLRLFATGPSFVWVERSPCSFVHTTKEKPTPFASPSCDLTTGLPLFWEERCPCSFVPITLEKQTDTHRAALFVYGADATRGHLFENRGHL